MGEGKKHDGEKASEELTGQEMLMRIMHFYISQDTTDEQRRKIYEYALKVLSAPAKPAKPDDPGDDKSMA
ncbi:MAG: hypothetical protein ACLGJB_26270 [Blastocatellia bacterium]